MKIKQINPKIKPASTKIIEDVVHIYAVSKLVPTSFPNQAKGHRLKIIQMDDYSKLVKSL